jgi:hypothetical protein
MEKHVGGQIACRGKANRTMIEKPCAQFPLLCKDILAEILGKGCGMPRSLALRAQQLPLFRLPIARADASRKSQQMGTARQGAVGSILCHAPSESNPDRPVQDSAESLNGLPRELLELDTRAPRRRSRMTNARTAFRLLAQTCGSQLAARTGAVMSEPQGMRRAVPGSKEPAIVPRRDLGLAPLRHRRS